MDPDMIGELVGFLIGAVALVMFLILTDGL